MKNYFAIFDSYIYFNYINSVLQIKEKKINNFIFAHAMSRRASNKLTCVRALIMKKKNEKILFYEDE